MCSFQFVVVVFDNVQAFVYVVGGGNYIEYQNLQDYCKRQQNVKTITYGTSELMNASEFLSQVFVCVYDEIKCH